MKVKLFDYVSVLVAVGVVGGFAVVAFSKSEPGAIVRIQADDREFVYSLDEPTRFAVDGPLGSTEIEIDGNRVRVIDSPCRDKICVSGGWISQSGQWVACLPNRVFLRVDAAVDGDLDAQTF
jgi:hypothetical protein